MTAIRLEITNYGERPSYLPDQRLSFWVWMTRHYNDREYR